MKAFGHDLEPYKAYHGGQDMPPPRIHSLLPVTASRLRKPFRPGIKPFAEEKTRDCS